MIIIFFFFFDDFAKRLRQLRKSKGLTMEQLGDQVGSTKATIGNFENGNKKPSLELLIKIADFFEVSIDYLVGRTDNPNINH